MRRFTVTSHRYARAIRHELRSKGFRATPYHDCLDSAEHHTLTDAPDLRIEDACEAAGVPIAALTITEEL